MNIQEAKEEIQKTILSYTAKDAQGGYLISQKHQRPIFLMGAPGIGKTAIMEQVAVECDLPFLSYTMTHHTRQSVIGLPAIREITYGDETFSSTVYTMSEILAEVYRIQNESGKKEGVLFLDEINCVSETLLPTMLQFLQFKTFGTHRLPDGWIVACAGNPTRFNRSAREFDVVTLDRVKYLELEPDLSAWLSYARARNLHSCIISFLTLHPDYFCQYTRCETGKAFVTPRGWEDLSASLLAYEALSLEVSEAMFAEYLHSETISRAFCSYYLLFRNVIQNNPIERLFHPSEKEMEVPDLRSLSSGEKLCLLEIIRSRLFGMIQTNKELSGVLRSLHFFIDSLKSVSLTLSSLTDTTEALLEKRHIANDRKKEFGLFSSEEERCELLLCNKVREYVLAILAAPGDGTIYEQFLQLLAKEETDLGNEQESLRSSISQIRHFITEAFGTCPETYMFFTELDEHPMITS